MLIISSRFYALPNKSANILQTLMVVVPVSLPNKFSTVHFMVIVV